MSNSVSEEEIKMPSHLHLKCEERGCWHYQQSGYIYCICCLHGRCQIIPEENRS